MKLSNIDNSFASGYNFTTSDLNTIAELRKDNSKFKHTLEDLIEDIANHTVGLKKKGEDPTKKLKKEEILKFTKDLMAYKDTIGAKESQKVFIIEDKYPCLKEEFLKRGWTENPDVDSYLFDFKYCSSFKNVDLTNLYPGQAVNHTVGCSSFTKKVGLARYLRQCVNDEAIDEDLFFPRCYELTEVIGLFDFVQDYKGIEAYCKLDELLQPEKRIKDYKPNQFAKVVEVAVYATCLQKRAAALTSFPKSTDQIWINTALLEILSVANNVKLTTAFMLNKQSVRESVLGSIGLEPKEDFIKDFLTRSSHLITAAMIEQLYHEVHFYLTQAENAVKAYQQADPQLNLSSKLTNTWIIKPSGLSRGRGIHISSNLHDIIHYVSTSDCEFIAQKYIEDAMLIDKRRVVSHI